MIAQLSKQSKRLTAGAVLVFCIASTSPAWADDALYSKTLQATGWIYGAGDGTCWVVDREERLVVTNKHVVGTKNDAEVFFPMFKDDKLVTEAGEYLKLQGTHMIKGKVIARDDKRDLALVQLEKLPANVGVLTLAEKSAAADEMVLSIGNSGLAGKPIEQGTLWKMRTGKVVNKYFRHLTYGNVNQTLESSMLNSSLHTSPGDSGGPVVNDKGELVGVTSGGNSVDSFAIDLTEVRAFLKRAKENGRRPPVSGRVLTGTWTQSWTSANGTRQYAGLTLRPDGTVLFEDQTGVHEGTFALKDGRLTLELPGLARETAWEVNWISSDSFRVIRDGIEYMMERR